MVIGHDADVSEPGGEFTVLLLFDLERMLTRIFPLAGDKDSDPVLMGDKGSNAAPPVGAYLAG